MAQTHESDLPLIDPKDCYDETLITKEDRLKFKLFAIWMDNHLGAIRG